MNERDGRQGEQRRAVIGQAAKYVLTGDRKGSRGTRIAEALLGRLLEREGGKVTGRVVVAVLVGLAVAGLAFVAYRLLMLDLLMSLVREQG